MRVQHWSVLGCLLSLAWAAHGMEAEKLVDKLEPSIWTVTTFDAQKRPLATGNAVVVAQERVVTACHLLAKAQSVAIKRGNITYGATLEHVDTERDLCQLRAADLSAPAVGISSVGGLKVGQKVFALGHQRGEDLALSEGLVSSLGKSLDRELELIYTSALVSVGGGLFDINGRLIGITKSIRHEGQKLNVAIPAAWISEMPERSHEALAKDAQQRRIAESAGVLPVAVVERQIVGEELSAHFRSPRDVIATTNLFDNVRFSTWANGIVRFRSKIQTTVWSEGTYRVKAGADQMCIFIRGQVESPLTIFQRMTGCYKLFATGENQYALRSVNDNYYIKY